MLDEMRRTPPRTSKTQFNIRLEEDLIEKLDAWVEDLNARRTLPIDRSKLIRGVLAWAAVERPDWEHRRPLAAEPTAAAAPARERFVEPIEEPPDQPAPGATTKARCVPERRS